MKDFSVAMALADFVPVLLFCAAAAANWAAEGVNVAGQGLFLLAVWRLHRAGLPDLYRA